MNQAASTPKRSYHHGDLRKQLIDKAIDIIVSEGEEALTMRKLAIELGVSRTAAYHHFSDKQSLLFAIAEEGFRHFQVVFQHEPNTDDVEKFIYEYLCRYVFFAADNPHFYDLMFSSKIWKSEDKTASLQDLSHRSFKISTDYLNKATGGLLPDDISKLRFSQVMWSTMHGLSRMVIDGIYIEKSSIESICQAAAKITVTELRR